MNTMGQDREFTEEEIQFALKTVKFYKEKWEEKEKINLENDINMRMETHQQDRKYKELFEQLDNAELDKQIEEEMNAMEESENPATGD